MNKLDGDIPGVSRRTFISGSAAVGTGLVIAQVATSATHAASLSPAEIAGLPRVTQEMVTPPYLPKHDQVAKDGPKVVEVRFVVEEKKMVLDDDGAEIWALTFNGSVPGPMIVVHENDYVELTLVNPETRRTSCRCAGESHGAAVVSEPRSVNAALSLARIGAKDSLIAVPRRRIRLIPNEKYRSEPTSGASQISPTHPMAARVSRFRIRA